MRLSKVACALAMVLATRTASADPCVAGQAPKTFPICFDPGNRLVLQGGLGGVGGEISFRHVTRTIDNDVWWRLEHKILRAHWNGTRMSGLLYNGRYLRHARDGRLVLPTSTPKTIFLPFDVGIETKVLDVAFVPGRATVDVGVVQVGLLLDLLHSPSFRYRLTVGPAARWEAQIDAERRLANEHWVAPMTDFVLAGHWESRNGLTVIDARTHAGWQWSSATGWEAGAGAVISIERVAIAINDVPVSVFAEVGWQSGERGAWVVAGLRLAFTRAGAP